MTATILRKRPDIPQVSVNSVSELLNEVAKSCTGGETHFFRGHQRQDWKLCPRLGRMKPRLRFLSQPIEQLEQKMLREFKRLAVPHVGNRQLVSEWDVLSMAQHHGLPTRMLDWSSNPLVALWFAVEKAADDVEASVWMYRTSDSELVDSEATDSPFKLKQTKFYVPRHHDSRIVAQGGCFSVHLLNSEKQTFNSLDLIAVQRGRLRQFLVPGDAFAVIRDELARCGITRAALFPDLAGLCGHMLWQYEALEDEAGFEANLVL
jgi:hypothetical protein